MELKRNWDSYPDETKIVVGELYNHLVGHPFFDTTIRKVLGIPANTGDELRDHEIACEITINEAYWDLMAQLVDETLIAMGQCNRQGQEEH